MIKNKTRSNIPGVRWPRNKPNIQVLIHCRAKNLQTWFLPIAYDIYNYLLSDISSERLIQYQSHEQLLLLLFYFNT